MTTKQRIVHIEKICFLMLLILAISVAIMPTASAYYTGDVEIINRIIDENGLELRKNVPETWDKDVVIWDSPQNRIIGLRLSEKLTTGGNLNLTGLTELQLLECRNSQLTGLDITKNPRLMYLNCNNNSLKTLNVAENKKLIALFCSNNSLESLDLTNNKDLEDLRCDENNLKTLNVETNEKLVSLLCFGNQLTNLDVKKSTQLKNLLCNNNLLTDLDVTKNTKLEHLYCNDNQLTSLNVLENKELIFLLCSNNPLTTDLNMINNKALLALVCDNNQLKELDLSQNTKLGALVCSNNQLTNLDVTKNTQLIGLDGSNNKLASLDVTRNTKLEELYAGDQIVTLPSAVSSKGQLTIPNPIQYNGKLVTDIDGAKVNGDKIELSGLAGTSGNAEFTFSQLPASNIGGTGLTGKVIQPHVAGYMIILNVNGGTVDPEFIEVTYGSRIGTLPTPTRMGYDFNGWFDKAESGNEYTAEMYTVEDDTELFAYWTAKQYEITFDANSGTVDPEFITVTFDSEIETLPTPTRKGYNFDGWFDKAEGGNEYTAETYTLDKNTELFAQWTAKQYEITFDATGGTVDPEFITVTFDSEIETLPTPTRTGYSFNGWFDEAEEGNEYTAETYTVDENTELFAQWTANEYTIFFDDNGDTTGIESLTVTYDQEIGTLPLPIHSGYSFGGWFDALTGGTEYTEKTEYKVDGDTTLYSRWNLIDRKGTGKATVVDGITEIPTPEERQDPPQNNEPTQNNPPNPGGQESPNPNGDGGQNEPRDSLVPEIIIVLAVVIVVGLAGFGIYQKWKKP